MTFTPTHSSFYRITVPTYAMQVDGPRSTRVTTGSRTVSVEVLVDMAGIAANLGPRAARSPKGQATGLSNRVRVKVR